VKLSPKGADRMQLRALSFALRAPRATPRRMRLVFADALDRYLEDAYPRRASSRPRKDERNAWLAVDYLIRCTKTRSKNDAAGALSDACESFGFRIADTAIRKLPAQHRDAARVARQLIDDAGYSKALSWAEWNWQQCETASRPE
jgi:hypothetical protein